MLNFSPFIGLYVEAWEDLAIIFSSDFENLISYINIENLKIYYDSCPEAYPYNKYKFDLYKYSSLRDVINAFNDNRLYYFAIHANDSLFIILFFYFNCILVYLFFLKISMTTFWLIPSLFLFFSGLFIFLKIKIDGWNENVWFFTNWAISISLVYNILLTIFFLKMNLEGFNLRVGYSSASFISCDINLIKLIVINFILIILFLTNAFIWFFYLPVLHKIKGELPVLTLFLGFSAIMSFFQNDLFSIFLYLEIVSFCMYGFLFLQRRTNSQLHGLIRYVLFSLWITTFFVLGLSFYLSWSNSSTNLIFSDSLKLFNNLLVNNSTIQGIKIFLFLEPQLVISVLLFTFYFLFKLGIGPFFTWTVEVYNSCSSGILIAVSLLPKLIYFFLLFFLLYLNFLPFCSIWSNLIFILGFLTTFIGSFGIVQTFKLKEIYAWSSIIHTGNILCIFSCITKETLIYFFFYIFGYVLVSIGFLFLFLPLKSNKTGRFIWNTHDLFSINKLMALFAFPAIIIMASSSGFTPLLSFFMKFSLFTLFSQIHGFSLTFFLGFLNIIGTAIYLKVLRSIIGFNTNFFNFWKKFLYTPPVTLELSYILSWSLNYLSFALILGLPLCLDFFYILDIQGTLSYFEF